MLISTSTSLLTHSPSLSLISFIVGKPSASSLTLQPPFCVYLHTSASPKKVSDTTALCGKEIKFQPFFKKIVSFFTLVA